ncbi:hypothetical protein D3C73_1204760 [compost metagenome]
MHDHAIDLALRIARYRHRLGMVSHRRAVKGGGARNRQRQARVVHPSVVVKKAAKQAVFFESRTMRQDLRRRQLLVQDAFAPAAGHVVGPQQAFKGLGQTLVEHPVPFQDGKQERQALHQMPRIAPQALALVQRMAHEAQVALLDVAQATMHHLRGLGRRARGEVVFLDHGDSVSAQGGIQGCIGAGDAAPHDQHVELLAAQPVQMFLPVQA